MKKKVLIYTGLSLAIVSAIGWSLWTINSSQENSANAQASAQMLESQVKEVKENQQSAVEKEKSKPEVNHEIENQQAQRQRKLQEYLKLTPQKILIDFAKRSSRGDNDIAWYIIELVRLGHISVHVPMREGPHSEHYTPLYAALLFDKDISLKEAQQLKELGAITQNSNAWKRTLSKTKNGDVVNLLLENSGYSEQDKKNVVKSSFGWGNPEVFHNVKLVEEFTDEDVADFKQEIKSVTTIKEFEKSSIESRKKWEGDFNKTAKHFGLSKREVLEMDKSFSTLEVEDHNRLIDRIQRNQNRIDMFNSLNHQDKEFIESINQDYLALEEQKQRLEKIISENQTN